jgi:periplasmic protein TonB
MNYFKSISIILLSGICLAACNSSDSSSSGNSDTTKNAMAADSTMKDTTAKVVAPAKKKLKASFGEMAGSNSKKYTKDKSGVYDNAEVMPSFKGGASGIDEYVNNNLNPSQTAIDDSKEGTTHVMFVVDENGKVTDAHTMGNKLGDGLDEEAIRVVSMMPKWTPGTVNGKPVKVRLDLPVTFKFE